MTTLTIVFALTILFIQGLHATTGHKMIFSAPVNWIKTKFGEDKMIYKPFFACPTCMSSVYGTLGYWIFARQGVAATKPETFIYWIIWVFCLAGALHLISEYKPKKFEL